MSEQDQLEKNLFNALHDYLKRRHPKVVRIGCSDAYQGGGVDIIEKAKETFGEPTGWDSLLDWADPATARLPFETIFSNPEGTWDYMILKDGVELFFDEDVNVTEIVELRLKL